MFFGKFVEGSTIETINPLDFDLLLELAREEQPINIVYFLLFCYL